MIDGFSGARKWAVFSLLVLCHIFFFQTYPHFVSTNELSRLLLVSAVIDDQSLSIDRALHRYGNTQDKSNFNGHFYTDKAIGTSLLGLPVYAFLKFIAGFAGIQWSPPFLLLVLRIVCVTLPSLLFLKFLTRYWLGISSDRTFVLSMTFLYLFGTISFTYSVQYISHYLCGVLLFLSFYFLYTHHETRILFGSGSLSGMAVLIEYSAIFPVALLLVYLFISTRSWKSVFAFLLGGTPFALLLLGYNYAIFGTPFELTYRHQTDPYHVAEHAQGWIGLGWPRWEAFTGLLFSTWRGLFFFSPVLLFSIPGFYFFFKSEKRNKEAWLFAGIIVSLVLFYCSMSNWDGGWALGPRYLAPILPFLMTGNIFFFSHPKIQQSSRLSFLLIFTAILSIAYTVIGTITFPFPQRQALNPMYSLHLPLFLSGAYSNNIAASFPSVGPAILFFTLLLITWIFLIAPQNQIPFPDRQKLKEKVLPVFTALLLITALYQLTSASRSSALDFYIRASVYLYLGEYEQSARELQEASTLRTQ